MTILKLFAGGFNIESDGLAGQAFKVLTEIDAEMKGVYDHPRAACWRIQLRE
jgi:hypothetical protein